MELANPRSWNKENAGTIRVATRADAADITRLLQTAVYQHVHVDWHLPGDWLGSPGFVVQTEPDQDQERIVACLAVAADPLPAAWVRVAGIAGNVNSPQATLGAMLAQVIHYLRRKRVAQLAWLVVDAWPNNWLPSLGFTKVNEIETYIKDSISLPDLKPVPDLTLRVVQANDMERLAQIEAAAFDPLWRHSAYGLTLAHHQALSFDVALMHDKIVGYQLSAPSDAGVHLVRLTIHPDWHQMGIGTALLAHAFSGYHRRGIKTVSLNTQVDNIASQILYRKFGFRASGYRLPVWALNLTR